MRGLEINVVSQLSSVWSFLFSYLVFVPGSPGFPMEWIGFGFVSEWYGLGLGLD